MGFGYVIGMKRMGNSLELRVKRERERERERERKGEGEGERASTWIS